MQPRTKAHLALFTVAVIYGINYIVAKEVMNGYIGPRGFIFMRVIGASILFWTFNAFVYKSATRIDKKDWPRLLLSGFFGVGANQLLFFEGLHLSTPINTSVIMVVTPVLVLVMSALIEKERIKPLRVFGILLGGGGALYLILGRGPTGLLNADTALGNAMVFLNATFFAVYLIIVKPLLVKYDAVQIAKWSFFSGMLFVIPVGFGQFTAIDLSTWTTVVYAQATFVVVATTFIAYLFNIYALKTLHSTTVSIYIYLQPLLATLGALVFAKDVLTWRIAIAAALIFAGVYLVSFSKR
jgi:drug/metabolite transporter (DMT)-like permease